MESYYLKIPALKVSQPLGAFYVISINAADLLSLTFSEPMQYVDELGQVRGSQRVKDEKRLREIAKYIDSVEMAFPNSIILAANYTLNGTITDDADERWRIEIDDVSGIHYILIPKKIRLASIIDGQHRLNAFEYVNNQERKQNLQLVCSVYFDLPNSYQAFLFATINSNQKKVDRSLALEQFGYNVGEESEKAWTPEKFAVFLSRKLNIDQANSKLYRHIKVAPQNEEALFGNSSKENNWTVSTATIVDGILSLISSNPKRDRIEMQQKSFFTGRSREMINKFSNDTSPLRKYFIDGNDAYIYEVIVEYFNIVEELFWRNLPPKSYITKTVGIQALFDILKIVLKDSHGSFESDDVKRKLIKAIHIDFSDKFFQASGIGRSRIKNVIALAFGKTNISQIKERDRPFYTDLLNGKSTNELKASLLGEEEAESSLTNLLKRAQWNYGSKTVELFADSDLQDSVKFDSFEPMFHYLKDFAKSVFEENLPNDPDFVQEQMDQFDCDDLVLTKLREVLEDLNKMNWSLPETLS